MNQCYLRAALLISLLRTAYVAADEIKLGDLGTDRIHQSWGTPHLDQSVEGNPLSIGGVHYGHGVGTHVQSVWLIDTAAQSTRFKASVGVDDEVKDGKDAGKLGVDFQVVGDGKILFDSKPIHVGESAIPVDVNLTGVKILMLRVNPVNRITFGHADWVNGAITYTGEQPKAFSPPPEPKEILTPKSPARPRINSAKVVGVRPNHPLLFTVAATGDRPMKFTADNLPAGLSLDASTGQISGKVTAPGKFEVKVHATNSLGDRRP